MTHRIRNILPLCVPLFLLLQVGCGDDYPAPRGPQPDPDAIISRPTPQLQDPAMPVVTLKAGGMLVAVAVDDYLPIAVVAEPPNRGSFETDASLNLSIGGTPILVVTQALDITLRDDVMSAAIGQKDNDGPGLLVFTKAPAGPWIPLLPTDGVWHEIRFEQGTDDFHIASAAVKSLLPSGPPQVETKALPEALPVGTRIRAVPIPAAAFWSSACGTERCLVNGATIETSPRLEVPVTIIGE